jgi:hypothetical protein
MASVYQAYLSAAMDKLEGVTIIAANAFEPSKTVLIIFKMDDNELWLAEQNMKAIVAAVQAIGTDGKRLRLAAVMENRLAGLTITLSEQAVKDFDASADVIEWASIAEEYNVAKGLQ